jgi:hypothetical protein
LTPSHTSSGSRASAITLNTAELADSHEIAKKQIEAALGDLVTNRSLASGQPCCTSRHTAKAARTASTAIDTATAPASRKAGKPVA